MLQIQANENKCIELGRRGEDSAREVLFDISGWAELYGQGEARLIAKRYKDFNSYPAIITQNDTTVSWIIRPVDNDRPGYGDCELVYITNGSVVKSVIYQTRTETSLSDPLSPPDSPDTYGSLRRDVGNLEDLLTDTKENLVKAINEVLEKSGTLSEEVKKEIESIVDTNLESINSALEDKVDVEEGKSLSSNDFTDEYKNKVDSHDKEVKGCLNSIDSHTKNFNNPHNITAEQVGLGSVDNTSDLDKPISSATQVALNEIESIAKGRATGYVFDTVEDLDLWLEDEVNVSNLKLGDNLYIRAKEVPDYWWDGETKQQLETQKVDLTEYVKNTDYATTDVGGTVKIDANNGININSRGHLHIIEAWQAAIDAKMNKYTPITPHNLEYAVKSVGDGYYATEEQVGDISAALDELHTYAQALIGGDA